VTARAYLDSTLDPRSVSTTSVLPAGWDRSVSPSSCQQPRGSPLSPAGIPFFGPISSSAMHPLSSPVGASSCHQNGHPPPRERGKVGEGDQGAQREAGDGRHRVWASVRRDRRTGLRSVLATSPPREAEAREIENGRLRPEHCSKLLIGAWRHGGITPQRGQDSPRCHTR
jgi:hypothetical protein